VEATNIKENFEATVDECKSRFAGKQIYIESFGLTHWDTISNFEDIASIIEKHIIHCGFCNKHIKHWQEIFMPMFHNYDDKEPLRLLFFCTHECGMKWGEERERKRNEQ